jgi:hypothetical protein
MVEMGAKKEKSTNSVEVIYRINRDVLTGAVKRQPVDPCTFSTGT